MTTKQLAQEALDTLAAAPMDPKTHFDFLVHHGIIDRDGRVVVGSEENREIGDDPDTGGCAAAHPGPAP